MEQKNYKDYLNKTFLEELNYKIWTTKGTRFTANKRVIQISKLSNLANSLLSVYLIATGLLTVYNLNSEEFNNQNLLAYLVTCMSILLLVFSQTENSKNYTKKADDFHTCGIELSKIYNELRVVKTLVYGQSQEEKIRFTQELSSKYENILERFDNHEQIDFAIFKTRNLKYFGLNYWDYFLIKFSYYIKTQLVFHVMIITPPVIIASIMVK